MTTNTPHKNPTLIAEVIDQLASYDRPIHTSGLSTAVTSIMRRLVNRGVVSDEEVMTWNSQGYWEVTGATIVAILAKREDVTMTGIARSNGHTSRKEKHWALTVNAERWEKEREAREQALIEADTRFTIREHQDLIRVLDTSRFGKVNTPSEAAVAIFDTTALPLDVAQDLAMRAKRALVRKAVS